MLCIGCSIKNCPQSSVMKGQPQRYTHLQEQKLRPRQLGPPGAHSRTEGLHQTCGEGGILRHRSSPDLPPQADFLPGWSVRLSACLLATCGQTTLFRAGTRGRPSSGFPEASTAAVSRSLEAPQGTTWEKRPLLLLCHPRDEGPME